MIIRSCLLRTACRIPHKGHTSGNFFSRFYTVMHAMQASEEIEQEEKTIGKPNAQNGRAAQAFGSLQSEKPQPGTKSVRQSGSQTMALLAGHLWGIDNAIEETKLRLQKAYEAKAKRRLAIVVPHSPKNHQRLAHDQEYQAKLLEIRNFESLMNDPHSALFRNLANLLSPSNVYPTTSTGTKTLNSELQDLLREPEKGQLKKVAALLSGTQITADIKTFNILISRLTRLRLNVAAWTAFQALLKLGLVPDQYTISSLLNLGIVTGSYADFRKVVVSARIQKRLRKADPLRGISKRQPRNQILFGTLIKGCVKFGRMKNAETYIRLMRSERILPNMEIVTCMVRGYADKKDWWNGMRYVERALRFEEWDRKTVATLIHLMRTCGKPEFEEKVRQLAGLKGVQAGPDEDLAALPDRWKTKGLDVPDHMKMPTSGDVGALVKRKPSPKLLKRKGKSNRGHTEAAGESESTEDH